MKKIVLSVLLCNCIASYTYALPPAGPDSHLSWGSLQQNGDGSGTQEVKIEWTEDNNAAGYYLHYTDYNLGFLDFEQWNEVDLGKVTSVNAILPVGAAYWATVQAYNADGRSPISNVYPIVIKPIVITAPRIVAFISRPTEREGLIAGLKQFGKQWGDVSLDIITYDSLDDIATKANNELADPNVIALITTNTSSTLRVTQSKGTQQQPLVVAITATSTILKKHDNVLQIPASNDKQVQIMHEFSNQAVLKNRKMEHYAVVMEEGVSVAVYSFDLYLSLLRQAFDTESVIPLRNNANELFSQLVATFNFSGDLEQATTIADSLAVLKPDIVLYLGSAENFSALYDQVPNQKWLCSDSVYNLIPEGFQSEEVKILTLGAPNEEIGQGIYYGAYDTVGVFGQILTTLDGQPTRQKVLEAARQMKPYPGVTGMKSFSETDQTGWYDLLTSTSSGWIRVE